MNIKELISEIEKEGSQSKKEFTGRIIPTKKVIISGAPIPFIKSKAKKLVKEEEIDLSLLGTYYEIDILLGLMIAYSPLSIEEKYKLIDVYLSKADNWADIDIFSSAFKVKDFSLGLKYIKKYLQSTSPYERRFGYIHFLSNYVKKEYVKEIFPLINNDEDYIVQMGIAWLLSVTFIKCKEETLEYLNKAALSPQIIRMFIRKVCDSRRVSDEDKEFVKTLKNH